MVVQHQSRRLGTGRKTQNNRRIGRLQERPQYCSSYLKRNRTYKAVRNRRFSKMLCERVAKAWTSYLTGDDRADTGKKGETKFGLRLVSAGNSKVADIASEGEQRCIALAAFLS